MDYKTAYHYMFNCLSELSSMLEHQQPDTEPVNVPKFLTKLQAECEELRITNPSPNPYKALRHGNSVEN